MLHRAFDGLGRLGLNCTCVDQSTATTRERIAKGECYVATATGRLAASITLYAPDAGSQSNWYHGASVASIHQLAVDPDFQGMGFGRELLKFAETWARERGYDEIALDTPNPATYLVSFYASQGYRVVERLRFNGKSYRSVVLSKRLAPASRPAYDPREDRAPQAQTCQTNSATLSRQGSHWHRERAYPHRALGRIRGFVGALATALMHRRQTPQRRPVNLHLNLNQEQAIRVRTALVVACGDNLRYLSVRPESGSRSLSCDISLRDIGFEASANTIVRVFSSMQQSAVHRGCAPC
jgi:GNAT superfamily N-acetyltransferase